MKSFLRFGCGILLLMLLVCFSSCKTEVEKGLDEYYPFRGVTEIVINELPQTDYFLGSDEIVIPLNAKAFDASGNQLDVPENLIHFTNNNDIVEEAELSIGAEGIYHIVAHIGKIQSDTLTIRVLDPSQLSLNISIDPAQQEAFMADGKAKLDFRVFLLHNGKEVPPSSEFVLYCNDEIMVGETFVTNQAGIYKFKATGGSLASNEITVKAPSPVTTLQLAYTQHGNTFWADGYSEISFSLKAFDFSGQEIAPTSDVKLYLGTEVVDYTKRFTTLKGGDLVFRARGFNSESQEIIVRATAPVNYRTVRIPVIFHEVNTAKLTQAKIDEVLAGVTKAFRNQWNPDGGPKDPNSADFFIEVYPAERDPSGNPLAIKGLDRVTSNKQTFLTDNSQSLNEAELDAMNHYWPPEQYFNIWVYSNIKGDFAGYSWAYYPEITQPLEGVGYIQKGNRVRPDYAYGAFINADHLGPGDGVEVTAHEMGHALALGHVFDGNMTTHNGCSSKDTDYCPDTRPYDRKAYESNMQAEGRSRKACDGFVFTSTNIMDYYIGYENSFTVDQRKRVRHTIDFGLWLPTPFNNYQNGRVIRNGKMEKPETYRYRTPIACRFSK